MSGFIKKIIQFSLITIAFFSITSIIFAQADTSNSMSSISVNVSPSSPRAGDSVVLTLSSNLLDLNSSKIIWYIDGVARKETSSKSITIKAKSDGQKTTIRVVVQTSDGIIKEMSGEISPTGVDLIIEPMSYTLPFYKGKPFFINEGTIKIVAVPDIIIDGVKIASSDLNFKWKRGEIMLASNSGKGKDSIIINGSIPIRDINLGLQILDSSGNVLAENSKVISVDKPKILFYEDNPLYGILYNKAITGDYFLGTKEELDVIAKPFSFNFINDTPEESSYVWYTNGNYVAPNGKINELILRQTTTNLKGTASISLDVKNNNIVTQSASGAFNVDFGE